MTKPGDIPQWAWEKAESVFFPSATETQERAARAILSAVEEENRRWEPAIRYFDRYCQDEADDVENCVCGEHQHTDAIAFRDAIRSRKEA